MLSAQERANARTTQDFLSCIASHLSSREDCKGVEYVVNIKEGNVVTFEPNGIKLFPNRYRRSERDRVSVIFHVAQYHFPELVIDVTNTEIHVDTSKLVLGRYLYQYSMDHKRRRWIRYR